MPTEVPTADAALVLGAGQQAQIHADQRASMVNENEAYRKEINETDGVSAEDMRVLRRVPGTLPVIAYMICAVEFAERGSYYGVQPLIGNYVNRVLPVGGNGYGAPPRGTQQTAGALGMGTSKAAAVSNSFGMMVYALPVLFGWLADTKTGRFSMVMWGVYVCGIAHVLMVASGAKGLLADNMAKIPYFISLYLLCIGAAMFKPNVSPILLDQMKGGKHAVKTLSTGERVVVDPEATTERVMLWFYLLINVGGFMGVATEYTEKYVGWWLSFLVPLVLYIPLPLLLLFLRKRLVLHPAAGSDLGNTIRVVGICFKRGGWKSFGKAGFFEPAKPSVIALSNDPIHVPWNDQFVKDVHRAFQACAMFCFFPFQQWGDNGFGQAPGYTTTMLTSNGVPNDVISNFNSLSIIFFIPVLNYGLYPFLRNRKIHFGPVARITFGLFLAQLTGIGYTVINYYGYKLGPCGSYGTSATCVDANGVSLVSSISIWVMALPYALGGISELFVNVPAYGLAYSMAPPNMRGLVSALNLFASAITYAINLACTSLIVDPYLTWVMGGPTIIGCVATVAFWFLFKHLNNQEYEISDNYDYANQPAATEELVGERDATHSSVNSEKHDFTGEKGVNPSNEISEI